MRTTAAVCRAFKAPLSIEDIELADPGAGEVRVRLAACAICHSDIHYIDGDWGGALPAVFGHEASGVIEALGAGVTRLKTGDHVVVTLIRSCGRCPSCREGAEVFCDAEFALDRQSPISTPAGERIAQGLWTGAFAHHVVVEQSQVAVIPREMALDVACLVSCGVLTGLGAVINAAAVKPGSSAVVIGCGGVGLNSVQGALIAGCHPIIAVDIAAAKLEAARMFGATHTIDAERQDVGARVAALTPRGKADTVFVTVGSKRAIEQGIALMKRNGATVIVGMPPAGVTTEFDPGWLAADGQRIIGSKMGSARLAVDVPRIISLYRAGRLKLDELISGRYPLERINEAILSAKAGEALRNVILM